MPVEGLTREFGAGATRGRRVRAHDPRADGRRREALLHQQPAARRGRSRCSATILEQRRSRPHEKADRHRRDCRRCVGGCLAGGRRGATGSRRRCSGSRPPSSGRRASINATWGIYVKSLETGEEIAINADAEMETMSTIKIPLMIEVFEQIKAGKFTLTDKYTFDAADMRGGTGIIRSLDAGRGPDRQGSDHADDHRVGQHRDRRALPDGRRARRRQRAHGTRSG